MTSATNLPPMLTRDVCVRALKARDARFDGVFFVGITSTSIYCRPICPARVSRPDHRRFFGSAAAAERDGFRPCRRCRPELAPGRALVDAVSRLAYAATRRIAAGALNGRPVADLAAELCVSERHLRRALEREIGVSPLELAQTHRLLLAKRLLTDTSLSMSRVAFASGFQSVRRFNVVFRERYGMSPSVLRGRRPSGGGGRRPAGGDGRRPASPSTWPPPSADDLIRLSLAYRPPYAAETLLNVLRREAVPGIERVEGSRFARTVRVGEHAGVVLVDTGPLRTQGRPPRANPYLSVWVSPGLLPGLMPLLARLRHLFDLDAEPTVVDACLGVAGLETHVRRRPGLRIPGVLDGFEFGLKALLNGRSRPGSRTSSLTRRVMQDLGEPVETGIPGLTHLAPTLERVSAAGVSGLTELGVPPGRARSIAAFAGAVSAGRLHVEPGGDIEVARSALRSISGVGEGFEAMIAMRAIGWPDAFPTADLALQRAVGVGGGRALAERAASWRPWRAYAALHLWLGETRVTRV